MEHKLRFVLIIATVVALSLAGIVYRMLPGKGFWYVSDNPQVQACVEQMIWNKKNFESSAKTTSREDFLKIYHPKMLDYFRDKTLDVNGKHIPALELLPKMIPLAWDMPLDEDHPLLYKIQDKKDSKKDQYFDASRTISEYGLNPKYYKELVFKQKGDHSQCIYYVYIEPGKPIKHLKDSSLLRHRQAIQPGYTADKHGNPVKVDKTGY